MQEFKRFRKKVMRHFLIKTTLIGIGVGLLGAAAALLAMKLLALSAAALVTPLVGIALGIVGGIIYYRHAKPTDKQIALQLDKELGLHEKCATMIEYGSSDEPLARHQREDAQIRLKAKSPTALKFRLSIAAIVALVLAGGSLAGSFFVPQREVQAEGTRIYSSDDWDSRVHDIVDGEKSDLDSNSEVDSDLAEEIKDILNELEKELSGEKDVNERQSKVDEAKQKVDEAVEKANEEASESQQAANEQAGEEAKEAMDKMVQPSESQEGERSGSGQPQAAEGEGDGQETEGSGQGSESTEGQGSQPGEGSGEGSQPGQGEQPGEGEGEGAGSGHETERHTDTIYTQNGDTEYGDVINDYQGDAASDADTVGDEELTDTQGDYFNNLYGQGL